MQTFCSVLFIKKQFEITLLISFVNIAESFYPKGVFAMVAKPINIRY